MWGKYISGETINNFYNATSVHAVPETQMCQCYKLGDTNTDFCNPTFGEKACKSQADYIWRRVSPSLPKSLPLTFSLLPHLKFLLETTAVQFGFFPLPLAKRACFNIATMAQMFYVPFFSRVKSSLDCILHQQTSICLMRHNHISQSYIQRREI